MGRLREAVTRTGSGDLDAFYRRAYPRLVAVLELTYGNRADAEELAQDAFARLLPRWAEVSTYDDPEAWVRRVALNLATSRWRAARTLTRTVRRLGASPDVPAPSEDAVLLDTVLARLSPAHRAVLVLHHGLGLPVVEVARELDVPVGTVKSRLLRAREQARKQGTHDDA